MRCRKKRDLAYLFLLCGPLATPARANDNDTFELIFRNARQAYTESGPTTVLQHWMLNRAIEHRDNRISPFAAPFQSLLWASMGMSATCVDNIPDDTSSAGIWPIAMHNWLVRSLHQKNAREGVTPFSAFEVGEQQRFVSFDDVLSRDELLRTSYYFAGCSAAPIALQRAGFSKAPLDPGDRKTTARVLRYFLRKAKDTHRPEMVRGTKLLDARIFDINLFLTEMARREKRSEKALPEKRPSEKEVIEEQERAREENATVSGTAQWTTDDWLRLTPERRLFLFTEAQKRGSDPARMEGQILKIIDKLIEDRRGGEILDWISLLNAEKDIKKHSLIWKDERGSRLLGLAVDSGFTERATIALYRGNHFLEQGNSKEALRSFALAAKYATESPNAEILAALARRRISFLVGTYETDAEVLSTLRALLPREDLPQILEDLGWRAAFRHDFRSFEHSMIDYGRAHSASRLRMTHLTSLAQGKVGQFQQEVAILLANEPYTALRFLRVFTERLEAEDQAQRLKMVPTMRCFQKILAEMTYAKSAKNTGQRQSRAAAELLARYEALLHGAEQVGNPSDIDERARTFGPSAEVFAGSLRVAPTDKLPWPFPRKEYRSPNIFLPIKLTPSDWNKDNSTAIFGWELGE
jgi:hypothetical protein